MKTNKSIKTSSLKCAEGIADWLCLLQSPHKDNDANAGTYSYIVTKEGSLAQASNWNIAFAIIGLLSAYKVFNNKKYETAALNMANYLKTLQIFDPFKKQHYGAIREVTPQTPWCYTRDALSAAWAFIELYNYTKDDEYLERAILWGEWFMNNGMDNYGWPKWGIQFEPYFKDQEPQMCNNIQGSFQGGSLNFFYHLAKVTGDKKWTGKFFVNIADYFITHLQQNDGIFRSINASTKKCPDADPQNALHRANDDLGTLGLLCAYKVTENRAYLDSINKFMNTVFKNQLESGHFENNVAAVPVVLNTIFEGKQLLNVPLATDENINKAINALLNRQSNEASLCKGGIIEQDSDSTVCGRSGCYALIYLLKKFAESNQFIAI